MLMMGTKRSVIPIKYLIVLNCNYVLYCVHVMLKNGDPIVEFNKISLVWKESQNYAKFRTEEFELDTSHKAFSSHHLKFLLLLLLLKTFCVHYYTFSIQLNFLFYFFNLVFFLYFSIFISY